MKSYLTRGFRRRFSELPAEVQDRGRQAYRLFCANPRHPSLQFKQVHASQPIMSVRIGLGHRAVGVRRGDAIYWYWVGSHADYDRLLSQYCRAG